MHKCYHKCLSYINHQISYHFIWQHNITVFEMLRNAFIEFIILLIKNLRLYSPFLWIGFFAEKCDKILKKTVTKICLLYIYYFVNVCHKKRHLISNKLLSFHVAIYHCKSFDSQICIQQIYHFTYENFRSFLYLFIHRVQLC